MSVGIIIAFWTILLWFNKEQSIVAWTIVALIGIGFILLGVFGLFKPKRHTLKKRSSNLLLIILTVLVSLITFFITAFNYSIEEVATSQRNEDSINVTQKLSFYKDLFTNKPDFKDEIRQMDSKKIGKITFYYEKNQESLKYIDSAVNALESEKEEFERLFGMGLNNPVNIILYGDSTKVEELSESEYGDVTGYYSFNDQTIHLSIPHTEEELNEFNRTVVHEYTHHLLTILINNNELVVSDFPMWFHEGIASYIERKDTGVSEQYLKNFKYISFGNLDTPEKMDSHLRSPYKPYFQSMLFVQYMINTEGDDFIKQLVGKRENHAFGNAFKEVVGEDFSSYESTFIHQLEDIPSSLKTARGQFYQDQNPKGALRTLFKINKYVPNLYQSNSTIADVYTELGEHQKSIEYLQRIVKQNPRNAPSYDRLSIALLFKSLDQSIDKAELAVKYSDEDELVLTKGLLDKLTIVEKSVDEGKPFAGYLALLRSEYMISNVQKRELIKRLLESYPYVHSTAKDELISFEKDLK
ncbi:peptidase MA family metallohydrolase [Guptibacillus hwajinpoensis]|uniref:peptidase MA family metallohydrolase n=1 Tax=Guptibacillus hwajinpoensis TaxID=208199 RepID=UPI003850B994